MTTEELQEQGAIYFDKITDGFRDYKDVKLVMDEKRALAHFKNLNKEYGKAITFMGGIDNGKVDRFDWNQEMIEEATDQLCRDCGKLHFNPSTTHGLNFSCIPGVYEAVDQEIDKMTKEMF